LHLHTPHDFMIAKTRAPGTRYSQGTKSIQIRSTTVTSGQLIASLID
jgi:hypothetical protein